MHAHELQALRRLLFLTPPEAARWVAADAERPQGVEERTWNRWEAGTKPVPDNIARAVLALVAWRAQVVAEIRDAISADPRHALALPWVDDLDAWPDRNRARWRAHQSACAHVLASMPAGQAALGTMTRPPGA